jgi:DNA-binding Lrp family transcriptional regulator
MVTAYVLATIKAGSERDVKDKLRNIPEVTDVNILYGEYDVIIKIDLDGISELSDFILDKIRAISAIERTTTLIVAG